MKRLIVPMIVAVTLVLGPSQAQGQVPQVLKDIEDAFVSVSDQMLPSVVNIDVKSGGEEVSPENKEQLDELFRLFGVPAPEDGQGPPRRTPRQMASGSGFVFDNLGHIVTNNHVVRDADSIQVRTHDGRSFDAEFVASDTQTDVAVIKISATDLPPVKFGDSDTLKVGMFAIAAGSPRGLEGSTSFGHITALGREGLNLPRELRFQNFIQTDAAINFGNSGGPLCNIAGEVVGMNTAIVFGAESLGFAIEANTVKKIAADLINNGEVVRGYLGVLIKDARDFLNEEDLPDGQGAFVEFVVPGSPAEKAGLERYDVILKVNGQKVRSATNLQYIISEFAPGSVVLLEIQRDGIVSEKELQLEKFPENTEDITLSRAVLGMRIEELTTEIAEGLGMDPTLRGVLVVDVVANSPAEDAGIIANDVILEVAKEPVTDPDSFREQVTKTAEPGKIILMLVARGSRTPSVVAVRVPDAGAEVE